MKLKNIFSAFVRLTMVSAVVVMTASCGSKLDSYFASGEELAVQQGVSLATGAEYENFVFKGQEPVALRQSRQWQEHVGAPFAHHSAPAHAGRSAHFQQDSLRLRPAAAQ